MDRRVELLAPAGNYESFIGAINAGADAIYVGGEKFSARAYAENFDTDTLCACIKYAHLFGVRVYLTLNTLVKEKEFSEIFDYVRPFYEAGLDAVIVQDLGVLRYLKEHFPNMELHASTQMAVTGPGFVKLCKELGISRVVPARELSLNELAKISEAGIEVECFIHGAMCYCYSGMCLMSSILGGRSGNRGRCAQPCRLPYHVEVDGKSHKEVYTLSLKDMCTIEHIPALIKAGMSSFKIEGRMKRSEYAAGVTALYRKYIDAFYNNPLETQQIADEDYYILEHLYMRSQLHSGYLTKHNGKEMVTINEPSYSGVDEVVLSQIREKYLGYTKKIPVTMYGYFAVGEKASLTICTEDGISASVNGDVVMAANQAVATEETVLKQLNKLGNTHFSLESSNIILEGEVFLPNGMLNALRREAVAQLENEVISRRFPDLALRSAKIPEEVFEKHNIDDKQNKQALTVLVSTKEQLHTLSKHPIISRVDTVYMEELALSAYCENTDTVLSDINIAYAMPYILRAKDLESQKSYLKALYEKGIRNVLVRNVEALAMVEALKEAYPFEITTDASLYCWNISSVSALKEYASRITLPLELNAKELRPLRKDFTEQIVYGYIPLMISANCVLKTNGTCKKFAGSDREKASLKDRYGKVFTVITNCKYCYNAIYNSVPLSLHKKYNLSLPGSIRLQFSIEEPEQMKGILDYYVKWLNLEPAEFPIEEYTAAHENRQVE